MKMIKPTLKNILLLSASLIMISYILTSILLEARERTAPLPSGLLQSDLFENCRIEKFICDITAYCPEACCNSGFITRDGERVPVDWSDLVAAGGLSMKMLHGKGIGFAAVDTALIPLGSIIEFDRKYYVALDRGSAIRGDRIDLAFPTHREADAFGVKLRRDIIVYIPARPCEILNEIKAGLPGK